MRQPFRQAGTVPIARVTLGVSLAALLAGCSSDSQRFGPAPWSTATQQYSQTYGGGQSAPPATAPEATGSIRPPSVQSESLAPVGGGGGGAPPPARSEWTPPPSQLPPPQLSSASPPPARPVPPRAVAAAPPPPASAANPRYALQRGPEAATRVAAAPAQPPAPAAPAARPAERPLPAYLTRSAEAAAPPRPASHTVAAGESVATIARRYDVEPLQLAAANQLGPSDRLRVGQSLALPRRGQPVRQAQQSGPADRTATASIAPAERAQGRPPAQPAAAPAVSAQALVPPVTRNAPGQRSAAPAQAAAAPAAEAPAAPARPAPPVRQAAATPPPAAAPAAPAAEPPAPAQQAAAEPARSAAEFRWPVRGRVVTSFGRQAGGGQSDGIAIAVPAGTPVKAAENGVVAYAGNELRGYGNLVLIRHDGDWVTAYAHNSENLVRRGETVRRGQTIARAGQTGSVQQPQLLFEIRRGSTPVNPTQYLTGG